MSPSKKKLWWQEFTRPEIVEHAKKCDIALLPVGSIEQHGEHLPTGEDSYHAIKIAEAVAEKTGIMLLPCPWYGAHPYHHWYYAGTIPLRAETFINLVKDVVRGAACAGYNKFIILNCHGQEWALPVAIQELGLEGYFVVGVTLWEIAKSAIQETMETKFMHAEETETSLGLYLVPELVDMSKAKDETPEPLVDSKWYAAPGEVIRDKTPWYMGTFAQPEYKQLKYGVIGYPTRASAEKGRKVFEAAVNWLVQFIEELKRKYPPGIKPPVK
jgi:creatinine amidohydrolase